MRPPHPRRHLSALAAFLSLALAGVARGDDGRPFELRALQRLTLAGDVVDPPVVNEQQRARDDVKATARRDVEFGVIPTRMMSAQTWLNPVTNAVEQRFYPAILHPIPVLRATHARTFEAMPDLKTIALDALQQDPGEVELDPKRPFALVADDAGKVALLSLNEVTIPQDKVEQWRVRGTLRAVTLVDHIDDPVADRGRAVEAKEPLPLTGSILLGRREQMMRPTTFHALDLAKPGAKPQEIAADVTEGRVAHDGTVVDRVDMRRLRISDANGKRLGELAFDDDIAEFNVSPDGKRIAISTTLKKDAKDDWSPREVATVVYGVDGKRHGKPIWGYDDPAFLPDGDLLVTGRYSNAGLFIADVKRGKVRRIDFVDAPKETVEGREPDWWARQPAVSPDGKWVAYVSGRDAYVVGIDGRGWTPVWLTPYHEPQTVPTFSPDSKYVAMIVTPLNVMTGPGQVIVFDVRRHVRQAVEGAKDAYSDVPITWRP